MARRRIPIGGHGRVAYRQRGKKVMAFCRFRDHDGVLREVAASGDTADDALQALNADLDDRKGQSGSGGSIKPDTSMLVLVDKWLADCECRGLSDSTLRIYRSSSRLYLREYMKGWQVRDATPGRVNDLLNRHMARKLDTKALRKHLNQIFALAVLEGALSANPVAGLRRTRRERQPNQTIESPEQVAEIATLIKAWEGRKRPGPKATGDLLLFIMLLVATGVRPGELLALRWRDVAFTAERPYLVINGTIKQEKGKGIYRQPYPKTASSIRRVELPAALVASLLQRQAAQGTNPLRAVFPSRVGTWQAYTNMRRRWVSAVEDGPYEWVTFKTYRKSVATLLTERYNLTVAKEQLGHANEATTREFYAGRFRAAPQVAEAMESLLGESLNLVC